MEIRKRPFPVTGMSCASCAVNVERALLHQPGVTQASVNYANATAFVEYTPSQTDPTTLRKAVQRVGYDLLLPGMATEDSDIDPATVTAARKATTRSLGLRAGTALLLCIPQVILGMSGIGGAGGPYWSGLLATPVVLILGGPFFRKAVQLARHGTANMDTLVALSTGTAYLFSVINTLGKFTPDVYFEAASVVIAFVLLGKWLENRASASAGDAIERLMHLQPALVTVEDGAGGTLDLPISELYPGARIRVRPGERVAVDGTIREGESYVDESMFTGEPLAVPRHPGETVLAGTLNQKGTFVMQADKMGKDTVLSGIIRQVREAQGSKAPVQRLVDRIAGLFVPVVIGIALLTFGCWWVVGGTSLLPHALLSFVSVLVIACPCALGLATPTAILVGIGKGAEEGIFIKDVASLENLRNMTDLALDKTGTLTEGKPLVDGLHWFSKEGSSQQAQAILYSLECLSEHPLAGAICAALATSAGGPPILPLTQVTSVTGSGIEGTMAGARYRVGNARWLQENGVGFAVPVLTWADSHAANARTVVFFAKGTELVAGIALSDRLRVGARSVVADMVARGIRVHLLTGDAENTAAVMAVQAGITSYRAGLLPADKANFIRSLQEQGKIVAMAGDGINDAPALAQADIGIAMGSGTDIAMDVAGITLVRGDLGKISEAERLSERTLRTIRQNLIFAFVYNIVGIPIAAGVLYPINGFQLSPMIAGAAMALSSITVVGNSLRLKMRS